MTIYWNDNIVALFPTITWSGSQMNVALMHQVAVPTDTTPDAVDSLVIAPGFQEVAVAGYVRANQNLGGLSSSVSGTLTTVIYGANVNLTPTVPVYVAMGVFYLIGTYGGATNPWVFMTDEMFGNIVTPGAVLGTSASPKDLLSYTVRSGGTVDVTFGDMAQAPGPSVWESARAQHIYLYPQRINWIPNPSYENVNQFGWRSNGALTRLAGGVDNPGNYYGHTAGTYVQSISIPRSRTFRFSAFVRGPGGTVTLSLHCLDLSYNDVFTVSGVVRTLTPTWIRVDDILLVPDDMSAVIPTITCTQPFDFDLVLLNNGPSLHDYFDGDSATGLPGDFSWQTAPTHQSYSFWYNNRYATAARLFGGYVVNGQVAQESLLQQWVPEDTSLYTHWDVLNPTDTKHPLKDWNPKLVP